MHRLPSSHAARPRHWSKRPKEAPSSRFASLCKTDFMGVVGGPPPQTLSRAHNSHRPQRADVRLSGANSPIVKHCHFWQIGNSEAVAPPAASCLRRCWQLWLRSGLQTRIRMSTGDKPPLAAPEARRAVRRRVLLGGKIVHGAQCEFTQDCTIRNVSDSGARIEVTKGQSVPANFYLIDLRHQVAHEAAVVWRRGTSVGLTFRQTHELKDESTLFLRLLRQIWLHSSGQ